MTAPKKQVVSYSDAYYRPVDTKVAKKGWYVDKYTVIKYAPYVTTKTARPIAFPDEQSAKKFARRHFRVKD